MFEDSNWIHRLPSRLHLFIAVIVSLAAAGSLGIAMGEGDFFTTYLVLIGLAVAAVMVMLGQYYWLFIPLAHLTDLPTIPIKNRAIELPELTAAVCTAVFIIRYFLRKQSFTLFRAVHIPVLLYAGWTAFIYFRDPVGLSEMGSAEGGGRNYAKIAMALAIFVVIANQKIGERECRWLVFIILFGSIIGTAKEIILFFRPVTPTVMIVDPESFYSWHQSLANIPLVATILIFARYPAREIFSLRNMWMFPLFALCIVIILLSGKRSAVAVLPIFAITAAIARREWSFLVLWTSLALILGTVIVVGHGSLFRLPLTAQRAVSWLPGKWDIELQSYEGGNDEYRRMLRILAAEKIKLDPWIGTGFKMDRSLMYRIQNSGPGGMESQVAPMALGSAWHNTWLGYAADFGIPASFMIAIIYATYITVGVRVFRRSPPGSFVETIGLYIVLFVTRDLAFSHISGHSALDAFSRWWLYATLISIGITLDATRARERATAEAAAPKAVESPEAIRARRGRRPLRLPAVR
jgi:hypothetical protein